MRAFVIGNGPSLLDTPMDRLGDEFTIACNRFDMLELDWNPDMWILADVAEQDPYWDWDDLLWRDSTFFFREHDRPFIEPYERPNVIFMDRCTHNGPAPVAGTEYDERIPIEWHLPLPCEYGGGISIALQAAATLGRNPIYLVGCDLYEYRGPDDVDINHFHPEYCHYKLNKRGEEAINPWLWELLNLRLIHAHEIARDSAAAMGITIYNATVGGKLEVYERVDIEEVLNERPL